MIITQSYEIKSCDDVELGIKRESKLEFKLSFDNTKEIETLFFIIPGLGGDASDNYRDHLASFVAENFNVAVCSINYHSVGVLPQVGAKAFFDDTDKMILSQSCKALGIELPFGLDELSLDCPKDLKPYYCSHISKELHFIDRAIEEKKQKGELLENYFLRIHTTFAPTKNEYQNFGIMQAQDIINALLFIKQNPPFKTGGGLYKNENFRVILLGSSHGGYLAHLAAKMAPYLIDAVIDNSSYAKFLWNLVGFGKEIDYIRYSGNALKLFPHIIVHTSPKTLWTINKHSKNFFSPSRRQIRNILEPAHLEIQSAYPKPIYVSYHSIFDRLIAPPQEKAELYKILKNLGFDATLNMITSSYEIDGKFIKNLTHGLGMSLKSLIQKELPGVLEKLKEKPKETWQNTNISYPCEELIYHFSLKKDKILLECEDIEQN